MSLLPLSIDPHIITAVTIFAVLVFTEPFIESSMHRLFGSDRAIGELWGRCLPRLLRALTLIIFVYLAYPAIFGISVAPSIGELLGAAEVRASISAGVLFALGYAVSFLPGLSSKAAFVLSIQGSLATGFVFVWLTNYLGITTTSLWPGLDILLTMLSVSYLAHRGARVLGRIAGAHLDNAFNGRGYDRVCAHVVEMLAQIPVILLYGIGLGRQIAI